MKKISIALACCAFILTDCKSQCTCDYSFTGNTDTIFFTNLSSVSFAHYYWNFGDGDGSNELNPMHVYPDDGEYLVTLYGHDTISDCSNYHQTWIDVTKPDTMTCTLSLTDSIIIDTSGFFDNYLHVTNTSENCDWLDIDCSVAGPAGNYCNPGLSTNWGSTIFMIALWGRTYDSIYNQRIFKEYFKTLPFQFSPAVNYQNCSSNFEVTIEYQDSGALVKLEAMNKSGEDVFYVTGFGNPINLDGHSASFLYPYYPYRKTNSTIIEYVKTDTATCGVATIRGSQQLLIKNPFYKFPTNCVVATQPRDTVVKAGMDAKFIIRTEDSVAINWQQDAGFGFQPLTDAGPYHGAATDTLTISSVTPAMNNFKYRCEIGHYYLYGYYPCHNFSDSVKLTVGSPNDLDNLLIYPNPVSDRLFVHGYSASRIKVLNTLEQLVIDQVNPQSIDMSNLAEGLYSLFIYNDTGQPVKMVKVVKR